MHSDDIKAEIKRLKNELDDLDNDISDTDDPMLRLELIRARIDLLNADALNELNWSFYYLKEEMKTVNANLQRLR